YIPYYSMVEKHKQQVALVQLVLKTGDFSTTLEMTGEPVQPAGLSSRPKPVRAKWRDLQTEKVNICKNKNGLRASRFLFL
ncbi:MAG: hypothetical protein LUD19_05520, partial [Clostridia bacterium]|nr:hypothetical protein [Clostridia bacterium]